MKFLRLFAYLLIGVVLFWQWELFKPVLPVTVGLSGDVSITLAGGLWQQQEKGIVKLDITLDLVCDRDRCSPEVWAYAPQFDQADHEGTVEVTERDDDAWRLQVKMTINPDPWRRLGGTAKYFIELQRHQNQLAGNYAGTFNDQPVSGPVTVNIHPHWPKQVPDHLPVASREHPRLLFRRQQLPELQEKVKTRTGQAILTQLKKTLAQKIEYGGYVPNGGYHAAGHCFLYLLNGNQQEAETAWQIVENSMNQPGPRLLEESPIVAGVALAYDLCYEVWNSKRLREVTTWLAQQSAVLIKGTPNQGWNPLPQSNWNARARGAAGLAALAILSEPDEFFFKPTDSRRLLKIAERNVKRYLTIGIGEHGFGSEGDHYTTEPWILTIIPFLQAYKNVMGKDLSQGSSAEWFLPHYIMRIVGKHGKLSLPTYGRHHSGPASSLFAVGLSSVLERFLPGVVWFFNYHLGWDGDRSFGIELPHEAAFALVGYRDNVAPINPADVFGRVLVDEQKGFYLFRNQWQDERDFVATIYLKRQPLGGSWSFPEAGSFRIWGLGGHWANALATDGKRQDENVVVVPNTSASADAQPTFFQAELNGSGVVSMRMNNVYRDQNTAVGIRSLRSFAVDYSGASGAPGLFVVVDNFMGESRQADLGDRTWVMHSESEVNVEGKSFTIQAPSGATMKGTFVTPDGVQISFQKGKSGGTILATGGAQFFVVMTVQYGKAPEVEISGTGKDTKVKVGGQSISFTQDRIVLAK